MNKNKIISVILLLSASVACQKNTLPQQSGLPLSFSSGQTKTGLSEVYDNFKVFAATQSAEGATTVLMNGYRVNYLSGWTYTSGEGTDGQAVQFWDHSAYSHSFHAGSPVSKVRTITASSIELDLCSTTSLTETSFYSDPYLVKPADALFGHPVTLNFRYANARVNLAVKYLTDTPLEITDLALTPATSYATAATLGFDYDWSRLAVTPGSLNMSAQSSDPLTFADISIPAKSEEFYQTATPWYVIPDPASKGQWTLSLKIAGEVRSVQFTVSKAWEIGKSYLYRFEYTDKANLVFVAAEELFIGADPEDGGEHNFE